MLLPVITRTAVMNLYVPFFFGVTGREYSRLAIYGAAASVLLLLFFCGALRVG